MNRKPLDSDIFQGIASSTAAIEAPRFNLAAIQARKAVLAPTKPVRSFRRGRAVLVLALPIALVLAVVLPTMPSVIAQVQRVLQAFAVVDGHTVPLTVRTVSLEQARAQMPFQVVVPGAVPPGLKLTINELYSASAPSDARLIFQYSDRDQLPVLTINESSASSSGRSQLMVTERATVGDRGPLAAPPGAPHLAPPPNPSALGNGSYAFRTVEERNVNGHVSKQSFELHPIVWVQHGTRIVLAAIPGKLTPAQVDAIHATMSR